MHVQWDYLVWRSGGGRQPRQGRMGPVEKAIGGARWWLVKREEHMGNGGQNESGGWNQFKQETQTRQAGYHA